MEDGPRKRLNRKARRSHDRAKGSAWQGAIAPRLADPAVLERQRRAFELRAGFASFATIAQVLGCSRETAARDCAVESDRRRAERPNDHDALIEESIAGWDWALREARSNYAKLADKITAAEAAGDSSYAILLGKRQDKALDAYGRFKRDRDILMGLRRDELAVDVKASVSVEIAKSVYYLLDDDQRMKILRAGYEAQKRRREDVQNGAYPTESQGGDTCMNPGAEPQFLTPIGPS